MGPGHDIEVPLSPYRLFQERYAHDPWQLLCCTICLNLCTGKVFETVHHQLFKRWPTAYKMAEAQIAELEVVLKPLGLQRRRARSLVRMSTAYAFFWDGEDPNDLPGIGKYGADSYRIFVRGELYIPVEDKELRKYLEWITS